MRVLLVVGVVVLILFVAGIIRFERGEGETTIHIDTDKIERTAEQAVERGEQLIPGTKQRLDKDDERDAPDRTGARHSPVRPVATSPRGVSG